MKDIRLNILQHFNNLEMGTAETPANNWLHKLHPDLGTIRRALIELVEMEYIALSSLGGWDPVTYLNKKLNSAISNDDPHREERKSSKRLVEPVGEFEKIPELKIYTTVKGIQFIIEFEKLRNDSLISKWQRIWFWVVALVALSGLAVSILSLIASSNN